MTFCLTERQLQYNDDVLEIEVSFQKQFKIHFNSNENKYQNIAFCYANDVLHHEDYNVVSTFNILKPSFYKNPIRETLLYRSPNLYQVAFIDHLNYFITAKNVDFLLGDFNIDAFNKRAYAILNNVLRNYNLMVREATHLDGAPRIIYIYGSLFQLQSLLLLKIFKFQTMMQLRYSYQ